MLLTAAPKLQGVKGLIADLHKENAQAEGVPPLTKKIKSWVTIPHALLFPKLGQISPTKMDKALNREIGKPDSLWGKELLLERESALGQSDFT